MTARERHSLKLVEAPSRSAVVTAPPVIVTSHHTVDYCCGHCGTVLLQAEAGQINNLLIRCTQCGSTNSTDL